MTTLASLLTFVAVFLMIFAINSLLGDVSRADRSEKQRREEPKEQLREREGIRQELQRQEIAAGGLAELSKQLELEKEASRWEKFQDFIAQSGLRISAPMVLTQCAVCGAIFLPLFLLVFGLTIPPFLLATLFTLAPLAHVAWARSSRLTKIREQLPDALELIGRVLRAGQTIVQAMNSIGEEYGDPIGGEFARCYEQQNLGLSVDVAMKDMARRIGLVEVKIFVLAVLIHQQAGGNLTELLERLAQMMRGRMMLRGEIKSLTAEGRMQAIVLILLPICVWGALAGINPDYAFDLFNHPILVMCTIGMMLLGSLWIHRIVNFDF